MPVLFHGARIAWIHLVFHGAWIARVHLVLHGTRIARVHLVFHGAWIARVHLVFHRARITRIVTVMAGKSRRSGQAHRKQHSRSQGGDLFHGISPHSRIGGTGMLGRSGCVFITARLQTE